jgi:hypothetical protein
MMTPRSGGPWIGVVIFCTPILMSMAAVCIMAWIEACADLFKFKAISAAHITKR